MSYMRPSKRSTSKRLHALEGCVRWQTRFLVLYSFLAMVILYRLFLP